MLISRAIGVRLDSGDLAYLSREVKKIFRETATKCGIPFFSELIVVASNDINEATILSLNQQEHEIDAFGIGTHLVTCQSQPGESRLSSLWCSALGCVFKLVEVEGKPRIKLSQDVSKMTLPGKKICYRLQGAKNYPIIDIMVKENGVVPEVGQRILCLHPFDEKKRAVSPSVSVWVDACTVCHPDQGGETPSTVLGLWTNSWTMSIFGRTADLCHETVARNETRSPS